MTACEARGPATGSGPETAAGRRWGRAGVAAVVLLTMAAASAACAPPPYARATFRAHEPDALAAVESWYVDLHPELMTPEIVTERDALLRDDVEAELRERLGSRIRESRSAAQGVVALYPHTHHTMLEVEELHFDDVEIFFLAGGRAVSRLMITNGHVLHDDQMSPPFDDGELASFCADRIAELLTGT